MKAKTTTIRALAVDVLVVETTHGDAAGHLFYLAAIFVRHRTTGVQRLVRKTRIPGAGQALVRDVQKDGLRALDAVTACEIHP